MSEELEQTQVEDTQQMYLDEIANLKQTTVSKEDYNKLLNENRNLLKSIVEGKTQDTTVEEQPSRDIKDILGDFNSDSTNLDHIKAVLELHDKRLEQGYNDFVPMGHNISPTDEDIKDAQNVYDFLQDLVKTADGNADVFNNEYQRRVKDIPLPKRK